MTGCRWVAMLVEVRRPQENPRGEAIGLDRGEPDGILITVVSDSFNGEAEFAASDALVALLLES